MADDLPFASASTAAEASRGLVENPRSLGGGSACYPPASSRGHGVAGWGEERTSAVVQVYHQNLQQGETRGYLLYCLDVAVGSDVCGFSRNGDRQQESISHTLAPSLPESEKKNLVWSFAGVFNLRRVVTAKRD